MSKPELAMFAKQDGTGRAYRHPFRTDDNGKAITAPSVTTVLNLVDKPALMQWAADQTLQWAVENVSLLYVKDQEDARRWGRYRWRDVRDLRAEVGTGIHETIESIHTGGWNYPVLDDEQRRIMKQWERLNERYEITAHKSEFTVFGALFDSKRTWAGTGDGLWDIIDRKTGDVYTNVVIDLKTSKNMWPEHWLQLSALRHAEVVMFKQADGTWVEEELPAGDGTAVIHLREDKFEVHIETDTELLDMQYDQFMAYRTVWETKKAVEARVSARAKDEAMKF